MFAGGSASVAIGMGAGLTEASCVDEDGFATALRKFRNPPLEDGARPAFTQVRPRLKPMLPPTPGVVPPAWWATTCSELASLPLGGSTSMDSMSLLVWVQISGTTSHHRSACEST